MSLWASQCPHFAILNSGHLGDIYSYIIGVCFSKQTTFYSLDELYTHQDGHSWFFGFIPYEYKNEIEPKLFSNHKPRIGTPQPTFFKADAVLFRKKNNPFAVIFAEQPETILKELQRERKKTTEVAFEFQKFQHVFTKKSYIETIKQLQEHIKAGDVYEINLTQEFHTSIKGRPDFAGVKTFQKNYPVPMGAWMKLADTMILSASPERFLCKENNILTGEPIKGTIKRKKGIFADLLHQSELKKIKYQAENVMIVDLVRNDLNRVCIPGTVHVPSLFRIETYKNLHHLVSEIRGILKPEIEGKTAVKSCFPPGSMTGAPKIRSMELINTYEPTARGIYSGVLGYVSPEKNFDFSVVIRTLVMDLSINTMSYHVGGAITIDSDPMNEYEESLLKAQFIKALQ